MKLHVVLTLALCLLADLTYADPAPLSSLKSAKDLESLIASTDDAKLKSALTQHKTDILEALAKKPHVDFVAAALDQASGSYEKSNTTPDDLKVVLGGASTLFDTLLAADLSNSGLSVKAKRESDPFDAAFYQHLGEISDLESVKILHTQSQNDWIAPLAKLSHLKRLDIINQGKLDDEGLAHLAPLKQLECLGYIGTQMKGHPFKDFKGWDSLTSSSFRGSKLDDEGLAYLCEAFPNYESLSLAHAHFTDAGAVHLAKLTKLKSFEIGTREATPQCLKNITGLPIEYLQLGDGLDSTEGINIIKDIKTLKRLTLTNCTEISEADLKTVSGMKQLEHLELGGMEITPERLALLKDFAYLKSMRLVNRKNPYSQETQNQVTALLPDTQLQFQ